MGTAASCLGCYTPPNSLLLAVDDLTQLTKKEKISLQPDLLKELKREISEPCYGLHANKQAEFLERVKQSFKDALRKPKVRLNLSNMELISLPTKLKKCLEIMPVPVETLNLSNNKMNSLPNWLCELKPIKDIRIEIVLANVPLSQRTLDYINQKAKIPYYDVPKFSLLTT